MQTVQSMLFFSLSSDMVLDRSSLIDGIDLEIILNSTAVAKGCVVLWFSAWVCQVN